MDFRCSHSKLVPKVKILGYNACPCTESKFWKNCIKHLNSALPINGTAFDKWGKHPQSVPKWGSNRWHC